MDEDVLSRIVPAGGLDVGAVLRAAGVSIAEGDAETSWERTRRAARAWVKGAAAPCVLGATKGREACSVRMEEPRRRMALRWRSARCLSDKIALPWQWFVPCYNSFTSTSAVEDDAQES